MDLLPAVLPVVATFTAGRWDALNCRDDARLVVPRSGSSVGAHLCGVDPIGDAACVP